MLYTIDTIFNRGFTIVDIGISRILGIKGKEPKVNGVYPSISKSTKIVGESNSSIWLLCKWNQLNNTDFDSQEQVKALFEGMNTIKEGKIEYQPQEDLYTLVVFTYTVTAIGVQTKERVKLWLKSTINTEAIKDTQKEEKNSSIEIVRGRQTIEKQTRMMQDNLVNLEKSINEDREGKNVNCHIKESKIVDVK